MSKLNEDLEIGNTGVKLKDLAGIYDSIFPVGYIYITKDASFDPNVSLVGTWQKITGKFLYANAGSTYADGNGTGTTTNNHTLTANQSGLRSHSHRERGYYSTYTGVQTGNHAEVRSRSQIGGDPWDTSMESTGGWNATEGHSHKIPYFAPFIWERTA